MKANKLRTGNWAMPAYGDTPQEVSATDIYLLDGEVYHFDPIPLSEQWLKEFGFEWYEPLNHWRMVLHGALWYSVSRNPKIDNSPLYFTFCNLNWDEGQNMPPIKIEYVHQLQNLYFALTGEELERCTTE